MNDENRGETAFAHTNAVSLMLRRQAWERAKGELRSIQHTFWVRFDAGGLDDGGHGETVKAIERFIAEMKELV